jgi:hypothetical protein
VTCCSGDIEYICAFIDDRRFDAARVEKNEDGGG